MNPDRKPHMNTVIRHAESDSEIAATFAVMVQLRPDLVESDYVPLVRSLMASDGYRVLCLIEADQVRAVAGYRFMHMLYCGRILSIDDLVTDARSRSHGHGAELIAALKEEARTHQCAEIHLISRKSRVDAHRFYLREGFELEYLHFAFRDLH